MTTLGDSSSSDAEPSKMSLKNNRSSYSYQRNANGKRPRKLQEYKAENYEELPKQRGTIRLLNLMPSGTDDNEIHCELLTPREGDCTQHAYEALSWCWGHGDKKSMINIRAKGKNYAKYISRNLFAALKALRLPDRDKLLWVDQISICQENLDEKNHQVEMMHEIYGNAERVCIWLGEETPSSRIAIKFIKEDVLKLQDFDKLCDSGDTSLKWRALLELMQRAWFSRRWVVQEIALARKAVIYCGKDKISWNKFAIAVELFVEVETATHRLSEVMKKDRQGDYIPGWFEYVSALGASLLVDATERLFRDYKEERRPLGSGTSYMDSDVDSDSATASMASEPEDQQSEGSKSSSTWKAMSSVKKSRVQPLLSLEYLVSSLTIFETTVPHDTIYALLAIAKDTTPIADRSDAPQWTYRARAGLEMSTQRKAYNVDYQLPYVDVCKEFIQFSIDRSLQVDRSRALDVICRPWATQESVLKRQREEKQRRKRKAEREVQLNKDREAKRRAQQANSALAHLKRLRPEERYIGTDKAPQGGESIERNIVSDQKDTTPAPEHFSLDAHNYEDMPLPSWVPQLTKAPYGMYAQPGISGPKMSRKHADPLVGLPSLTQRNYSAAETKGIDMKSLKFRKRSRFKGEQSHYSMYIRGFCLDEVRDVEQDARNGQIPMEWAELGGWQDAKGSPPDAFWRTLVADRGKDGKNPPVYYSKACKETFKKGGFESGAVDTTALINYERNSIVAQFCRRVQSVIWNRALIMTQDGRLGLVSKDVEKGDKVCILYGCSVPVILRKSERKTADMIDVEVKWELVYIQKSLVTYFRHYLERKSEHRKREITSMVEPARRWWKNSGWKEWREKNPNKGLKMTQDWLHLYRTSNSAPPAMVLTKLGLECQLLKLLVKAIIHVKQWYSETQGADREAEWKRLQAKREEEAAKRTRRREAEGAKESNGKEERAPQRSAPDRRNTPPPQITDLDWLEFELQLRFGRRWRRIVKERKANFYSGRYRMTLKRFRELKRQYELRQRKLHNRPASTDINLQRGNYTAFENGVDEIAYSNIETDEDTQAGAEFEDNNPCDPRLSDPKTYGTDNPPCGQNVDFARYNDPAILYARRSIAFPGLTNLLHATQDVNKSPTHKRAAEEELEQLRDLWPREWSYSRKTARAESIRALTKEEASIYDAKILENFKLRLEEEDKFWYRMLGECYVHGMMDGEAMIYQIEGKEHVIPSQVFEIR